jgi:cytochrome P450
MAGVAFAAEGDGVGFATESYAASALYTTLASLSGALWRIRRVSEAEVRSNILTFIAAGHETTANTLSWTMFLLSQSPEWRERVEAEVDRELIGPAPGITDRLVRCDQPCRARW